MSATSELTALRFRPAGSKPVEHPLGVCYVTDDDISASPLFTVIAYAGKAGKRTFYESYRTREARDRRVTGFFSGLEQRAAMVAERRKQDTVPHTLKVGDIIYNSWGYDQTNIDFYVVTKTTANYAWLQSIACEGEETGFMCGNIRPVMPPVPCKKYGSGEPDEPEKHRVNMNQYGPSVHFEYGCGSLWDGRDKHNSWYA